MSKYRIVTDSGCDLAPDILKEWDVIECSLTFRFDGDDKEYADGDMPEDIFYAKMREGGVAKTAAVNSETFAMAFRKVLEGGEDLLYLGFSSGLSTTFNSARIACEQLKAEFPDRKIIAVDTLAASAGQGLLLCLTVQKKNEGASIDEAAEYAKSLVTKLCHWFTVDDLVYLKRGGRISPTAAFVGNVLGIKPVLHMDNEGHLINMYKVRGRKTSVAALADKYGELADDKEGDTVFISHGDCINDAKELEGILKQRYGAKVSVITYVGPVIGSHSGPGTLALFFVGSQR